MGWSRWFDGERFSRLVLIGIVLIGPGGHLPLWSGGNRESEASDTADRTQESGGSQERDEPQGTLPAEPPVPRSELPADYLDQDPPGRAGAEFQTDFSRATVAFSDVLSGGPPKDGIPSIDSPQFVSIREAGRWIGENEAVLVLNVQGDSLREQRIYPLQILTWHEIVNDTVAEVPVAVTYCPLCNTGVAFDRRMSGAILEFGTTGRLRFSNLIMYDRTTESWWQQASGRGIAGFFAGARLSPVPIQMLSFSDAAERYPDATVLSRETGYSRSYGRNPYVGYDTTVGPFLYRGPTVPGTYDPLERVLSIEHAGEVTAVAYSALAESGGIPVQLGGTAFIVIWRDGTASALDTASLAEGRDVGSANAFFAETTEGISVAFDGANGAVSADGTEWDHTGLAVSGPRRGEQLRPAPGVQHFWFSHAALVESLR